MNDIIYVTTEFYVNIDYLEGLFGFLDLKQEPPAFSGKNFIVPQAQITFENVSFRYPYSDCDALKNMQVVEVIEGRLKIYGAIEGFSVIYRRVIQLFAQCS